MSTTEQTMTTAQATDTQIAVLANERTKIREQIAMRHTTLLRASGAKFYYRGKRLVTDVPVEAAIRTLQPAMGSDDSDGTRVGAYDLGQCRRAMAFCLEAADRLAAIGLEMATLEQVRTDAGGWSRFFVVTSSAGHIHSSMCCHTCRPTTAYGWLPMLSGLTEADAVAAHGPALCTACFPSAPVEHVGGRLTKAQAAKVAA